MSRHRAIGSPHRLGGLEVPAHARGGQVTPNLHDHLAAYAPTAQVLLAHLLRPLRSRSGRGPPARRRPRHRVRLQWGPFTKVYRENGTSAFKKRKVIKPDGSIDWIVLRPEFRQLLADLALPASCPPGRLRSWSSRFVRPRVPATPSSVSNDLSRTPGIPPTRYRPLTTGASHVGCRVGQRLASSASLLSR
ncbi:hypothetical protein HOK021_35960 [Streptomyces hygroscopicus]|nr:hypothetical protein HOK021_35960 [Streptomyces hygroscopicus]